MSRVLTCYGLSGFRAPVALVYAFWDAARTGEEFSYIDAGDPGKAKSTDQPLCEGGCRGVMCPDPTARLKYSDITRRATSIWRTV